MFENWNVSAHKNGYILSDRTQRAILNSILLKQTMPQEEGRSLDFSDSQSRISSQIAGQS
jgi:hypothetical protein